MLHPSYTDLMKVVNSGVEEGETPVVNSRYSIVLATSKRARQIIAGEQPLVPGNGKKPLSMARRCGRLTGAGGSCPGVCFGGRSSRKWKE